jgi:hypothetical protein
MDRKARYRFAFFTLIGLIPLMIAWWFVVDDLVAFLRPPAAWLVHLLLPVRDLLPGDKGGWIAQTNLEITAGKWEAGRQEANFPVDGYLLRRYLVAWPFFFALALAPPRAPKLWRVLLTGFAVLVGLFLLSAAALVAVYVTVLVNHVPSPADRIQFVPPAFYVAAPHYSGAVFFLTGLAFYLASYVMPLLAPVLLWIGLNPIPRRALLGPTPSAVTPTLSA